MTRYELLARLEDGLSDLARAIRAAEPHLPPYHVSALEAVTLRLETLCEGIPTLDDEDKPPSWPDVQADEDTASVVTAPFADPTT